MLKITRLCFDNSEKLSIGTKTANVLAISSIRIDDFKMSPEVVSVHQKKISYKKYKAFFLSNSSIQLVNNTLKSSTGKVLPIGMDPLVHMRQLRSKIQQRSTYSLGRFYISLFQYAHFLIVGFQSDSDCIIGSKFMELIG